MKFDIVMSNPPYNSGIDIKILNEVSPLAGELMIVHPATWLLDMKFNSQLFNVFRNTIGNKLISSEMFNGNIVFGIQLFVPTTITHIDNSYNGLITVNYFGKYSVYERILDITVFGDDWKSIVKPFSDVIEKYIDSNCSVWQKAVEPPTIIQLTGDEGELDGVEYVVANKNKVYCQLADIRGTPNRHKDNNTMHLDDFYTLVTKAGENNEDVRKSDIKNTYKFNTIEETRNFIKYCKTDFARFCVAIYKINAHLDSGELFHLPYLDFTIEWDDDMLYKKFGVDEKTQSYIKDFLPDFHNIRN